MKPLKKKWIKSLLCIGLILPLSLEAGQFYMGESTGLESFSLKKDIYNPSTAESKSGATDWLNNTITSKAEGEAYNLYFGFRKDINSTTSLGVELNTTYYTATTNVPRDYWPKDAPDGTNTVYETLKFGGDISVVPGIFITPKTLLFAKLGVGDGKFSSSYKGDSALSLYGYTGSFDEYHLYYRLGMGIEQAINNHWSARLEYSCLTNSFHPPDSEPQTEDSTYSDLDGFNYTYQPTVNTLSLGLTYNF